MQEVEQRREQLPSILTLPPGDKDFSTRLGLLKSYFSRSIETGERVSESRTKRGERGIWQRRFWEHLIRDEADYQTHIDYIHWNPAGTKRGGLEIFQFSQVCRAWTVSGQLGK